MNYSPRFNTVALSKLYILHFICKQDRTSKFRELWSAVQQQIWPWSRSKVTVKVTPWYHRKGLVTKNTHAKYQSSTCNRAKVMAKVKVFVTGRRTDRRTDGRTDRRMRFNVPALSRNGGQLQTYGQKDDPSHKSFKVSLLHVQFVFMCWLYDIVICSNSTSRMNRLCLTNKIRNIFHHLSMYCSSCMSWKLSKSHRPFLRSFYCYLNRRDLCEGISTHTTRQDGQEHYGRLHLVLKYVQ